ncbi:hypothetical protein [Leeia aquatica]|uniref:Capsular biosynthesis protein n=1 Tax=Leeia aquatica TaxID=2725557 RepID=A0A847S5A6_9NEIS|nr:hypothetical protein [Leeia aquatica]NLR75014.1 hypothetical protein [Leeia aquatica]
MIIILSALYVGESLRAEVGDLPLSFVPLANRRLYAFQVEVLRRFFPQRPIALSVPANFHMTEAELSWFEEYGVSLIRLESVTTLGEEAALVLEQCCNSGEAVMLMHGACLPASLPTEPDSLAVFETDLEPGLPVEIYGAERDLIWAGIASFADVSLLASSLAEESLDYYRAVKRYSFKRKLRNVHLDECYVLLNAPCYFRARSSFTTERAFNRLTVNHTVLKKFSSNGDKIRSEANWFNQVPRSLRKYIPQYFGEGVDSDGYYYSIEYLGAIPLSEIFVYGRQTVVFWERIFSRIEAYLHESRSLNVPVMAKGAGNHALFVRKAESRLAEFSADTGFNADVALHLNGRMLPSLKEILADTSKHLMALPDMAAFLHGDLCLSNILYDSRMRAIKLIDPRGVDEDGQNMIFGSQLYDVAKLAHSVIGLYDHIIAGQYHLSVANNNFTFSLYGEGDVEEIQAAFRRREFGASACMSDVEKILPLLFIAMLPLHKDSPRRQMALLANALRLYVAAYR